jgi:integrase
MFDKPKVRRKPVEYASDQWFNKVLPYCGARLIAILTFMTLTGARVSEACALRWEDVDISSSQALLRNTKNGSPRLVDLAPPVVAALSHIADTNLCPNKRVFGYAARWSVNQAIRRACKRSGAPYLSSHKVGRHAFAARLLRAGHSLKLVQEAGGWKVARIVADHYGHLERSQVSAAVKGTGANLTHPMLTPPV